MKVYEKNSKIVIYHDLEDVLAKHKAQLASGFARGQVEARERCKGWCSNPISRLDLIGADLREVDFKGLAFKGVDFRYINFNISDLDGVDLRGVDLRGADFECASLRGASLRGANLRGVNLGLANLEGADLRDVTLGGTCLTNAYLNDTYFRRSKYIRRVKGLCMVLHWRNNVLEATNLDYEHTAYLVKHNDCVMVQLSGTWATLTEVLESIGFRYSKDSDYAKKLIEAANKLEKCNESI